jgi:hypothetical protein
MPCELYKDALIEAAASGATPQGGLRAHLENCDSCRSALASKQALFFFIDEALGANANADVPPTLLPRVRARLNEEHSPARSWANARFLLACAAALVFIFFITRMLRPPRAVQKQWETTAKIESSQSMPSPPQTPNNIPALPPQPRVGAHSQVAATRNLAPNTSTTTHLLDPEVLVPHDQEFLLASYQQQWMSRKRAPLVAQNVNATTLAPLEVPPIQIAELDVKLMAEQHGE